MYKSVQQMKWWGWGDKEVSFDMSHRPDLWPFINRKTRMSQHPIQHPVTLESIELPPVCHHPECVRELEQYFSSDQYTGAHEERVIHAYGKSFRDLWRIRRGLVTSAPDMVIYPESNEQVSIIIAVAHRHNVVVIPFGGGSNIAGCVEAKSTQGRMVISLDMKRMGEVLSLDAYSRVAVIQAGAMGPALEKQLNAQGFTLGHFPDSFEYSSLGGWVATRSAGMQSDTYGKIEDMVIALRVVTPTGELQTRRVPKASNGIDVNHMLMGSEGIMGVITEVTVQVHRIAECQEYLGYLFPNFSSGVSAMHECVQCACVPSMTRLNDPGKTQLSFAFKSSSGLFKTGLAKLMKWYLARIKKIDFEQCCLMLNIVEGDRHNFKRINKQMSDIYRRHGAVYLGKDPGRAFSKGKFDFPYLRDYCMDRNGITDVSETATTWENLLPLYHSTVASLKQAMQEYTPHNFLGCHISHTYHSGASLYFTFGAVEKEQAGIQHYLAIKKAAEDAFIEGGASLSHHHAVGYEHLPWIQQDVSVIGLQAVVAMKQSIDPHCIMNPGKIIPGTSVWSDWGWNASTSKKTDEPVNILETV